MSKRTKYLVWGAAAFFGAAVVLGVTGNLDQEADPVAAPTTSTTLQETTTTEATTTTTTQAPRTTTTVASVSSGCESNGFDLVELVADEFPLAALIPDVTCDLVWSTVETAQAATADGLSVEVGCPLMVALGVDSFVEGSEGSFSEADALDYIGGVVNAAFYAAAYDSPEEDWLNECYVDFFLMGG